MIDSMMKHLKKGPTVNMHKIGLHNLHKFTTTEAVVHLLLDNAEMVRRVLELSLLDWILAGRYSKEFS